jgi:hypothetical protein
MAGDDMLLAFVREFHTSVHMGALKHLSHKFVSFLVASCLSYYFHA